MARYSTHTIMTAFKNQPQTGRRVAATLIDYILLFTLTFMYIYQVGERNREGTYQVTGLPALVPLIAWFLYIVVVEKMAGATLGHKITGLKVVSSDGNPLSWGQVFKRRIADILDITWCFGLLAFILVLNTEHHQRLGDIWAGTLVVDKNEEAEMPQFDFSN